MRSVRPPEVSTPVYGIGEGVGTMTEKKLDEMEQQVEELEERWEKFDQQHGIKNAEIGRQFQTVTSPEEMTQEEREEHNVTHIPYNPGCPH